MEYPSVQETRLCRHSSQALAILRRFWRGASSVALGFGGGALGSGSLEEGLARRAAEDAVVEEGVEEGFAGIVGRDDCADGLNVADSGVGRSSPSRGDRRPDVAGARDITRKEII